jgi:uncharacterized protein (TIGR00730 family)
MVRSMHERKSLMSELSEGFATLPGGTGTLEEFVEVLSWAQLGVHRKPCGLLNVKSYYELVLAFSDHLVTRGFLSEEHRAMVLVDPEPEPLLEAFARLPCAGYQPRVLNGREPDARKEPVWGSDNRW